MRKKSYRNGSVIAQGAWVRVSQSLVFMQAGAIHELRYSVIEVKNCVFRLKRLVPETLPLTNKMVRLQKNRAASVRLNDPNPLPCCFCCVNEGLFIRRIFCQAVDG